MSAQELIDELRNLAGAASDITPAFEEVVEDFADTVTEAFDTQGSSIGRSWEPLTAGWVRSRQRQGKGTDPLKYATSRGGRILGSLTSTSSPFHVRDIRDDEVRVGSRFGLTAQHHRGMQRTIQWGPNRGRRYTIPARPVFAMSDDISRRWAGIVDRHVHAGDDAGRFGL